MSDSSPDAWLETVIDSELRRIPLGAACSIGRSAENTIVRTDGQVSRRHCLVQQVGRGEYHLIDLNSANGTFVNGRRVTGPVSLEPGARIGVGGSEFVFHGPAHQAQTPANPYGATVLDISEHLITVLVADIRGYTPLSQRLGEVRISELVSTFMRESGKVLNAHGAVAQKYLGDAVMAVWQHRRDPPNASELSDVVAALAKIFDIASGLQPRFGLDEPVCLGAGINTGPACVGNLGSDAAADYTAVSDAVNLSFRLEKATKDIGCQVALGERTYGCLATEVPLADLFHAHTVTLKGYANAQEIHGCSREGLATLLDRLRQRLPADPGGVYPEAATKRY
jgi:adenylate cyclase